MKLLFDLGRLSYNEVYAWQVREGQVSQNNWMEAGGWGREVCLSEFVPVRHAENIVVYVSSQTLNCKNNQQHVIY